MAPLDGAEVARHDNKKSCWIVLDSKVYDVTGFLSQHPGGAAVLLRQGGTVSNFPFKFDEVLKFQPVVYSIERFTRAWVKRKRDKRNIRMHKTPDNIPVKPQL
jgi:cytochrome b involved in lipid metabolism